MILVDKLMLITDAIIATSIPFLVQFLLWSWVFDARSDAEIGGFDHKKMMFYYGFVLLIGRFNNGYDVIKVMVDSLDEGRFEVFLIKPISFPIRLFFIFLGEAFLYAIPIVFLFVGAEFSGGVESHSGMWFVGIIVMIIFSQILTFLTAFVLACCAFWVKKSNFLCSLQITLVAIFGGVLLPASLWGEAISALMKFNPLHLQVGALAGVLANEPGTGIEAIVFAQICWIVIFFIVARLLWGLGSKRYLSTGG